MCDILEIKDVSQAVESLDADEKGISQTYTPGGKQNMTVINESGLYALVFRSKKPEAKQFTRCCYKDTNQAIRNHVDNEDKLPRKFDGLVRHSMCSVSSWKARVSNE